jgi:hypothetical protein
MAFSSSLKQIIDQYLTASAIILNAWEVGVEETRAWLEYVTTVIQCRKPFTPTKLDDFIDIVNMYRNALQLGIVAYASQLSASVMDYCKNPDMKPLSTNQLKMVS